MVARFLVLVTLVLALAAGGAGHAADAPVTFQKEPLTIETRDGRRLGLTVELAVTPAQLSQGLMFRRSMPADAGMLFDFGRVQPVSMWMKNTLIPLDMVFVGNDGRVTRVVEHTVPMSTRVISSGGRVRAVVELNGGSAARLGIGPGDRVVHPIFTGGKGGGGALRD